MLIDSRLKGEIWSEKITVAKADERLRWDVICAGTAPKTVDLTFRLLGHGSGAEISIVYLGRAQEHTDMNIRLVHDAKDTFGRITAKAALFDRSRFNLSGLIHITPKGTGADSYFLAHALLVSPFSMAEVHPYLEIETDEVRASHGSSVGMIDKKILFYLESRGVERARAEHMALSGFFRNSTNALPEEYRKKFFQDISVI